MSVDAQIKKGTIFLGGDLNANTLKTKNDVYVDEDLKGISFSPVAGKFVKDNLVLGASLSVGGSKKTSGGLFTEKAGWYGAGIFVRKYKAIATSGFYIFLQGDLKGSYTSRKRLSDMPQYHHRIKRLDFGASAYPGLAYAISQKLHVEIGLNDLVSLSYYNEDNKQPPPYFSSNSKGFNLFTSLSNANSALRVGFKLMFGKS
jgi:hypothetical protein